MGTMMSPQDTYARNLQQPYGYPLRTPEPSPTLPESYQCDGLQIGDVGYVDTHGRFQVLFNIRLSSEHELHRKRGVPDQFEPIELDISDISDINSNEIPMDCVMSYGVEQSPRSKDSDLSLDYEFLSSSTSGAILMLPVGTVRRDLKEREVFRRIAVEHAHRWCAFARRDSLYLITGLHQTSSWALASFDHAARGRQIIVERDSSGTYKWDCRFNVDRRHSPAGNEDKNQTVFIIGFKIAVKWWAPEPLIEWVPRSRSIWSTLSVYICWFGNIFLSILKKCFRLRSVDRVPQLSQPYHPSDAINRYLLDKDRNAQVAITHDSQWISMLEKEELTHEELTQEGHLRGFLSESYTWNSDENVVYLGRKIDSEEADPTWDHSDGHKGFSLRIPPSNYARIVITRMRAENVVLVLRRMPIGFYITVKFDGMTIRTDSKSVLVCDNIIEWEDEILLPLDPSSSVRFTLCATFELDPMLGNGQALLTKEIKVKDLVGSMYLMMSPSAESSPPSSSLLVTFERRWSNQSGSPSSHISRHSHSMPHRENPSALSHETDLGHKALVRYRVHFRREDLKKAVEHFEEALILCPDEHPCRAAALCNLSMAKFIVCQVDGIYTALDEPISLYRQALELRPDCHPDRPATLLYLAQVLCYRYGKLRYEEAVADEIRELAKEAKGICSEGTHQHRAAQLVLQTCARYTAEIDIGREELDVLISDLDRASKVPPDGYFDVPQRLMNLSVAFLKRSRWRLQVPDARTEIDKAIALKKAVLHLTAGGDPSRACHLSDLAKTLYIRFLHFNGEGDLEEGMKSLRNALEIYPVGHHDRAASSVDLAGHLEIRSSDSGMLEDLDEAISLLRAELTLPHTHAPARRLLLEELSRLLHTRFLRLATAVDLDEAITLHQASLKSSLPTDPYLSSSVTSLVSLLFTRFDLRDVASDLDEAVHVCRDEMERYPREHPFRLSGLSSLGDALTRRFERLGALDDLNEAITIHQAGSEHDPRKEYNVSTPFWKTRVRCLLLRFNQLKTIPDLHEAIALSRAELDLCPPNDSSRYYPLLYLAACLRIQFENLGMISSLDESIALHREVMMLVEPYYDVSLRTSLLARCLRIRFRQLKVTTDLDEAITFYRASLDNLVPLAGHPYRPTALNDLAACLHIRFEDQGMIADLDEAITLHRSELELVEPDRVLCFGSGIAHCLTSRFHQSKEYSDMAEAFHHYAMLPRVSLGVSVDLEGAIGWVNAAEEFGHETRVLAYQTCLRFLNHRLIPPSPTFHHPPILENLISSLPMDAFSACLRDGRFSNAVELLDQGRDIFWSALLRLRSPLDEVNASGENGEMLAQSFMQLASLMRSNGLPDLFDDFTAWYEPPWKPNFRLHNIVSDIRIIPGLSRFLEPPLFSDLQEAASRGAVVIINASQHSCDALIVLHHRDPVHVPLNTTKAHVAELASRLHSLIAISEDEDRIEAIMLVLQELWSLVVSPIAEVLQKLQPLQSRIWWYPTAEFSLLPLHAAGPYEEGKPNFIDLYISSYSPSLTELMRARRQTLSYSTSDKPHFVAVDTAPDIVEDGRDSADSESELVSLMRRLVPLSSTTCVRGQDSKVARVVDELGKNEFVHIECSVIANPQRPFESSLVLSDGHLKMEDIMRLDTQRAKFAFLSASAIAGGDEPEQSSGSESSREMVHLTSAMLCAGFPCVVGPMWAVDPVVAKVMAARFYENMVGDKSKRLDPTRAALALHRTITSCTDIPFDQRIMWLHMGI